MHFNTFTRKYFHFAHVILTMLSSTYHFWEVHNLYQAKSANSILESKVKFVCFSFFIFDFHFSFFVFRYSFLIFRYSISLFVFHFWFNAFHFSYLFFAFRFSFFFFRFLTLKIGPSIVF